MKPGKSFVFHREGEKQRPWLNYSPPTQFRLICMQAVQLKCGFQPIPFRQKSQITDKSLSRTAASYFSGTEYLLIKIPPRRLVQKKSQPGMPGLEDGRVSLTTCDVRNETNAIKVWRGGKEGLRSTQADSGRGGSSPSS